MTEEDRLRDLLRSKAATIVPACDGLTKIQQRLARRRRLRTILLPGAALATAGATAAFFLLGGSGELHTLVEQPASHAPTPSTAGPTPTATQDIPVAGYTGPALWPFTSAAQAQNWGLHHADRPWAGDPLMVAQHFTADLLGIPGLLATRATQRDVVTLRTPAGTTVGEVRLASYDVAGGPAYTVVSVAAGDLTVTSPTPGAAVVSPTSVTGRITGVDENVSLRLISATGKQLATAGAPAGAAVPWQASLSWSDAGWTTAGIVATTHSLKDGALTRLAVVPVSRGTGTASATFVGLVQGHVALLDGSTGKVVRQLTYPPAGSADTGAAWNGSTLLWVRSRPTGCADELDRLDSGTTTTVVPKGTVHLGTPRLSPDGNVSAYLSTPCNGGAATVVVHAAGSPPRTLATDPTFLFQVADVRDDGTVLVNEVGASDARTLYVVPAGTTAVTQGTRLAVPASCTTIGGAFDASTPVTWESCADGVRVARYDAMGARTGGGPLLPTRAYAEDVSVHAGVVLAWLYDGAELGRIVRVEGGSFLVVVTNASCRTTPEPTGCVRAPDW